MFAFLFLPDSFYHVCTQVLEDKAGVFVNGLTQVPVLAWEAALDILSQGVLNRTTASTLMNTVSSRSHAVFTITLTQTIKDDAEPDGDPQVWKIYWVLSILWRLFSLFWAILNKSTCTSVTNFISDLCSRSTQWFSLFFCGFKCFLFPVPVGKNLGFVSDVEAVLSVNSGFPEINNL